MKVIQAIDVDRAFIKKRNKLMEDKLCTEPKQCFYTTKDVADYALAELQEVYNDIFSHAVNTK